MALRSVVVEAPASPPAPRKTVVVRTGAPAPKGRILDIVIGVIGVLLLVGAVALAEILPDKTYLNPQFRLTLEPTILEWDRGSVDGDLFETGPQSIDFPFELAEDNIISVSLILGFTDDASFSLPDRFDIDLIAPNGTQMGHVELENAPPRAGSGPADPPSFSTAELNAQFPTAPAYSEQIVTGLSPTETPEQVLARLEPDYHVNTNGTWIVRVTLVAAGDCPSPGEGYTTQDRDCRLGPPSGVEGDPTASPDGVDPGNNFLVSSFKYTYFTPAIKELS